MAIIHSWTRPLAAAALIATPLPAAAFVVDAPEEVALNEEGDAQSDPGLDRARAKMQKQMDEAVAFIEKMFDRSDLPPIEPARLMRAETTTAALIPPGSLEKMVDRLYGPMIDMAMAELETPSDTILSMKTGVESEQIAALEGSARAEIVQLLDPRRKEREEKILAVLRPILSEALSDMEAPMRAGLARAYAREYSAAQLDEINAFFATPTGRSFAGETMVLQSDPELILAMVRGLPPMVNKFMDKAPTLEAKFKDIPLPRTLADLDKAEMKRLAKLLNVDVADLEAHRDAKGLDGDDVEAAEDMLESYAPFERENWSEADRARVEELEDAAYQAEQNAIANARARLSEDGGDVPAEDAPEEATDEATD